MAATIRAERAGDEDGVRRVNEAAFGRPGEAALVDALRTAGAVIASLVAEDEGVIVGHILFSPATLAPKPLPRVRVDYDTVKVLFGRDPSPTEEIDNPSTPEKVALGKALYHEKHLSKNGNLSCASRRSPITAGR